MQSRVITQGLPIRGASAKGYKVTDKKIVKFLQVRRGTDLDESQVESNEPETEEEPQEDLQAANKDKRLFGILNGCEYPAVREVVKLSYEDLLRLLRSEVLQ